MSQLCRDQWDSHLPISRAGEARMHDAGSGHYQGPGSPTEIIGKGQKLCKLDLQNAFLLRPRCAVFKETLPWFSGNCLLSHSSWRC
jgi:hypothetical protein